TKSEFNRFIKENVNYYSDYKQKLISTTRSVKIKSVPYSGDGYELQTIHKNNSVSFILKTEEGYCYLHSSEKDEKNICGYFDYVGESKYGFVYTISEDYSDNKVLLYRSLTSKSIDDDIVIDTNVNVVFMQNNFVFYTKHYDNYFSPKDVYLYDVTTGTKSKIFSVKSKNVNDMIDDIYYDLFSQRAVIVKKSGPFKNLIYYDLKSKKIVDFFSFSKKYYSFAFTKSYVLVLYKNTVDDYNYLYL
ncbi:MAG: hypothetical protein QXF12_07375, partial [Candidatus Aenigmatarchaeota archaeon]